MCIRDSGNRQASEFIPAQGVDEKTLADAAQLASLADETPEGRSIVILAKQRFNPVSYTHLVTGWPHSGRRCRKNSA